MSLNRLTKRYAEGIDEFVRSAIEKGVDPERIPCPCIKCGNKVPLSVRVLKLHLIMNGIDPTYKIWFWHGEPCPTEDSMPSRGVESPDIDDEEDHLVEMAGAAEEDFHGGQEKYAEFFKDCETPLYDGSETTKISFLIRLYNMKARNGWSDTGFSQLLKLLKETLPEGNKVPSSPYEAKKILGALGMGYERIHACYNDCILYRGEYSEATRCPKCDRSRWKLKKNSKEEKFGVPEKVLWYISPIPRFQRWFRNAEHAKNLVWHAEGRIKDGKLRHPADAAAWKHVDTKWPEIAADPRCLRLGLSADGINPHSTQISKYSCWPVILCVYNLPPWLCMKRKFTLLTLVISGPRQPGNDIDVYLKPLVDDLKRLWDGVECYDAHKQEVFTLRGLLMWTINDFPAYGNLSGHCVKGYKACPVCSEETDAVRLNKCKKIVYIGHRCFLPCDHPYRRYTDAFNGHREERLAPEPMTGEEVFQRIKDLNISFGKTPKNDQVGTGSKKRSKRKRELNETEKAPVAEEIGDSRHVCWKKKSIFFELEYWQFLLLRHNLDIMHIEKNICDSLIGTLLGDPGKSKDSLAVREDL